MEQVKQKPANYDKVLERFRGRGVLDPRTRSELLEMANGGNPPYGDTDKGMREVYYQGWTDQDFGNLLTDLEDVFPVLKKERAA